jgi:hypothetical protein
MAIRCLLPPHFDVLDVRHGQDPLSRRCWGTKSENTSIGVLVVLDSTADIEVKQCCDRRKPRGPNMYARHAAHELTAAAPYDTTTPAHFNNYYQCNRCQYGPEVPLALHSAALTQSAGTLCILNSTPTLYNFTDQPRHECWQGQRSCIATAYMLDGSGIEFRWGRDFPHPVV